MSKKNYKKQLLNEKDKLIIMPSGIINSQVNNIFTYLSISIRSKFYGYATSFPSDNFAREHYIKNRLIQIDPLPQFELNTNKQVITFSEMKKYRKYSINGEKFIQERMNCGLKNGFNIIKRCNDKIITFIFATDYSKNGFISDIDLINDNFNWVDETIKYSFNGYFKMRNKIFTSVYFIKLKTRRRSHKLHQTKYSLLYRENSLLRL